ncbi:hypothetical protein AFERRI_160015 [Acidithiobacillus ferrivorans]|uniref:Uncharacterized protein n=1 Tax=Acidithiobacillus ferrivorans TaxID=160808 RepID=A0A060UKS3_9PROT|nr:hypothetical protein AFERRI_160015 [Acidithiobacillus ferrivorans]
MSTNSISMDQTVGLSAEILMGHGRFTSERLYLQSRALYTGQAAVDCQLDQAEQVAT